MSENLQSEIKAICQGSGNDRTKMMDIVRAVQEKFGQVSSEAMDIIAKFVNCHRVEVEGIVSFYTFLSKNPKGKVIIRLCNDVVDKMAGVGAVADAFKKELSIDFGQTTTDGKITLEYTPCIGMCDQAPAALINDEVITYLSTDKVKEIVADIKKHYDPSKLKHRLGDGNNADELVHSCVHNGLRKKGPVIFADYKSKAGLKNALAVSPVEIINVVKAARLRGRGGAGFPTGMKWQFTRAAVGEKKFILCNADEGEPGTFKDRVILTERADMLFEGMAIGGYAIGAQAGILYLRGEYAYLIKLLEKILKDRRYKNLLGKDILGKKGFNFDITIQMGAGAYICGEETALISSCEGLRGDPKTRPPFPVQKGYLGYPTAVNNVETLCCATRILEMGAAWFAETGSKGSPGTKLLSVSGDCKQPGVYELPFGIKVKDLLKEVGAEDAQAVLVGGPSGQIIGPNDYNRTICYDDLATGGAVIVFGSERDMVEIATEYMEFFVEENCGYCTPCRVGNVLLKKHLDKILAGKGEPQDLDALQELGESIKTTSRCGLGQTSPNPVLTTLKNFRQSYEKKVKKSPDGMQPTFDIRKALADAEKIANRQSVMFTK
ncbi:MAG: NAD(P)H-dependent oxidoreductase subunit E [Planctomycetes bacterium]|nr:NAD(P)H-dependent oxidoreductase subunit E [Planctomycetota bacterium]MBU1518659.1 NAD(P)H-dependent oxidoreductase subunit E [Planctomycetota bacterium]MBU2458121.1 NAD(P)H-dependent oxidoreductase subunit E [Planctomycetota bacterium]MBU2596196.1 NAD(P)H-dependent oxidoreductase subunit E [Planctomycetota bacterium]